MLEQLIAWSTTGSAIGMALALCCYVAGAVWFVWRARR